MSRVVLITGGTSGIGLALAEAFLARGDSVIVCARSQSSLDAFRAAHPQALAVQADVTDTAARARLLDAVAERFGHLDVLVNNAGTFIERDFTAATPATMADVDAEVALNLTAPVQLTGEVLARWPEPAALVFVTSGFALVPPTRAPTYGAVKAGLHAFAEALRRQLARSGTNVLEVMPPTTDTAMTATAQGAKLPPAEVARVTVQALDRRRPLALPGQVKNLPVLLRVAPGSVGRMVAKL